MLAGGLGAGALIALPDLHLAGRQSVSTAASGISPPAPAGDRYVLLYGTLPEGAPPGGLIAPAVSPAAKTASLPEATPVAVNLAAAPVLSPDQSTVALVTVDTAASGQTVTLTLVDSATAAVEKQGTLTVSGIADGTNIIATPVYAPGTSTIAVVLGITEPTNPRPAVKKDAGTGAAIQFQAVTWVSHHALAYFDTSTGAFAGPFHLGDAPALALSTAGANSSDLFVWTTAEPKLDARKGTSMPMPWVSVFPLGAGKARTSVPSPMPWAGNEPVVTLSSGDVARLVNGRSVQVASAATGEVTQTAISALSVRPAKPAAVTMTARPDGTVFIAKPGIGRAVITDPAHGFRAKAVVDFQVPAIPAGGSAQKVVLSASSETLYTLGGAKAGGVAAYDVSSGKLTGSFSEGTTYNGLYLLPSGNLMAVAPASRELAYFSPALEPLGTATTSLAVAAVF
jgi:hypothetical protein